MANVQERAQVNKVPFDKWSTREQLCLASAVSYSGDQNWMSVSRTLKLVCGSNRPADWFSHKSCAVQYGHMLENVGAPKRKKRLSEGGISVCNTSSVAPSGACASEGETSTDSILRQLTEERIQELKLEIQKEQEEYAEVIVDLKHIQSGQMDELQISDMWKEIEKEQEMQRVEEMKLENQLREREQHTLDVQRSWNATGEGGNTSSTSFSQKKDDKQLIDANLEEIIGSRKMSNSTQPLATSPLLSSLLKSPTSTGNVNSIVNTVHASAPTITTLLIGGALNPNQPALTLKSTVATNEAVQLLTRPISGPPCEPLNQVNSQTSLSPSQSAPTLSMLLEKNKSSSNLSGNATNSSLSGDNIEVKVKALISDSNNEEVPMDIEEDVTATIAANDIVEDSDADTNEEQQLLEVFKNIGNIDELEDIDVSAVIDEEVDFLKTVGDDNVNVEDDINFGEKIVASEDMNNIDQISKNGPAEIGVAKPKNEVEKVDDKNKTESISSDDSNDNVPLATLGNNSSNDLKETLNKSPEKLEKAPQEQKDTKTNILANDKTSLSPENILPQRFLNPSDYDEGENTTVSKIGCENVEENSTLQKSPESLSSDVIIIPTDDESIGDKVNVGKPDESKENQNQALELDNKLINKLDESKDEIDELPLLAADVVGTSCSTSPKKAIKDFDSTMQAPLSTTISLADTDEDSSTTDISISTRKDEKNNSKLNVQTKKDDNTINQSPAKPPAVRKLRDRDRSESPLTAIDDDTTASEHSVTHRSRRRYSSTPVIDSIPNSPASSDRDDRDVKISKKSLMNIFNALATSKNANDFQRVYGEQSLKLKEMCNRYIDLQTIKKNIENNIIRNIPELQRDILLMCQNAIMTFETNSKNYKIAYDFMLDCQSVKEFLTNVCFKENKPDKETKEMRASTFSNAYSPHLTSAKVRGSARKSQRIS